MTRFRHDAGQIARMLAGRAESLARELLPDGHREAAEWVAASRVGRSRRSLSVRIQGDRAGVWSDFAAGHAGDALDLVAHVMGHSKADAMGWARGWLGLGDDAASTSSPRPPAPAAPPAPRDDAEGAQRRRKAQALFLDAQRGILGTPVEAYLSGRGIVLGDLPRLPRALRFHPECWCAEAGGPLPAMVACIVGADGGFLATHRTYLAEQAGTWRKAPLARAKMVLGGYAGGMVPLNRGASGLPLHQAPIGDAVVIAEGIESALSCAVLAPELRTIAAVSVSNIARLVLPASLARVTLAADDDAPDSPAAAALARAVARFQAEGRAVFIARAPDGGDFNDALLASGIPK
ncbi:DUF7146 domain-containing protein [Humitalea sp. 24SJ18S-53]|uniref:DUF7146 domain-containing protein n=1 Tax=Humitalea sp. 24SJ18S-53 TaxID=3422307 RepID=UPI003D6657D7